MVALCSDKSKVLLRFVENIVKKNYIRTKIERFKRYPVLIKKILPCTQTHSHSYTAFLNLLIAGRTMPHFSGLYVLSA